MLYLANQETSCDKLFKFNCNTVIQNQNEEKACNLSPLVVMYYTPGHFFKKMPLDV